MQNIQRTQHEIISNQTGTSKVGALSGDQKAQTFFKCKRGPFGLFETSICCKISKNLKRGSFGDKKLHKKLRKKSHIAEKSQKGLKNTSKMLFVEEILKSQFSRNYKVWNIGNSDFQSALHEVKLDYYSDSFFDFFFNPHNELTKIVLQRSTKFDGVKLNHLAQRTEAKWFFLFFRVTYWARLKGPPFQCFFCHCETFCRKKFPQTVPLLIF